MAKTKTVPVDDDLTCIIVSALRYCMGRQTYMPSLFHDWVKRNWAVLPEKCRGLLRRDLDEELAMCKRCGLKLGADFDHRDWQNFLAWMDVNGAPQGGY